MRERKRLENVLSLEGDLVRRTDDIGAYFDSEKKARMFPPICSANWIRSAS